MTVHTLSSPFTDTLPVPLYFNLCVIPEGGTYPSHKHPWGDFIYSFQGVIEIFLGGKNHLVPPQYGIWIPPGLEHLGVSRKAAEHCSFYVDEKLSRLMPQEPRPLLVSPFIRAILQYLRGENRPAEDEECQRVLRVLFDQLKKAPVPETYLPAAHDPALSRLLYDLEENPGDERPLQELSRSVNLTERTLARRCQKELGMPLGEWRNRLRVIKALPLLKEGWSVEAIAFEFGYSGPSAFIAMFKRVTGHTPARYRGR